jgi:transposase
LGFVSRATSDSSFAKSQVERSLAEGFESAEPAVTGRPSYHPAVLLKIYIYVYLNRIQSSRRLEREAQRNVDLMWLTGRLAPDLSRSKNA